MNWQFGVVVFSPHFSLPKVATHKKAINMLQLPLYVPVCKNTTQASAYIRIDFQTCFWVKLALTDRGIYDKAISKAYMMKSAKATKSRLDYSSTCGFPVTLSNDTKTNTSCTRLDCH